MARARNIKPAFFTNDTLSDCQPLARLLFIGLWTLADREGRLYDRPKKIKAEILPYDDIDCDMLLDELASSGFVTRYRIDDIACIQVVNFLKHQNPHMKEGASTIPAPDLHGTSPENTETNPADSLLLIPDIPLIDTPLPAKRAGYSADFEIFWQTYPNRTGKAAAYKAYQSALKQHGVTHAILIDRAGQFAAAHSRAGTPSQYVPHPATWLNQGRWEDDLSRITARQGAAPPAANARGSQFNALMSAASKLMQEDGRDVHDEQRPALPEREVRSPFDIQFTREPGPASLPKSADRDDPAGGKTIDHDDGNPSHG